MKIILSMFILLNLNNAYCSGDKRTYTKLNSSEAIVRIETEDRQSVQASSYVDAKENNYFIKDLMNDKNSKLFHLKELIEKENCLKINCGNVTLTKEVQTSFGREGWSSSGGSYTFFAGFTSEGAGRYFDVSHMIVISETVDAQLDSKGNYAGVFIKKLNLDKIIRIDNEQP